jgi:hypothetical protein
MTGKRSKLADFIKRLGQKKMTEKERAWLDAIENPTTRTSGGEQHGKPPTTDQREKK